MLFFYTKNRNKRIYGYLFVKKGGKIKMLVSEKKLLFVGASRIKGTNKNNVDYDFANIEVSDGIGSLEMPLDVHLAEALNRDFARGQEIKIRVDARKNFGKTQFIVDQVTPLAK